MMKAQPNYFYIIIKYKMWIDIIASKLFTMELNVSLNNLNKLKIRGLVKFLWLKLNIIGISSRIYIIPNIHVKV